MVDNDTLSLQSVFRSWLHDCGTDQEHLHLILPQPPTLLKAQDEMDAESWETSMFESSGGSRGQGKENRLVLKCDIQERILNPSTAFEPKLGDLFVS